jgi:hypothetical protein
MKGHMTMFQNRKIGGIRFIRIGRVSITLSVKRKPARADGVKLNPLVVFIAAIVHSH